MTTAIKFCLFIITIMSYGMGNAEEFNLENALNPRYSLISTTVKNYFLMEASVPKKWQLQYNPDEAYFAITGAYMSTSLATVNDKPLMNSPNNVCSSYETSVCQNVNNFYKPNSPELIVTGIYKIDSDNILSFGFNTGYNSSKLHVSPSFLIGAAKRFYTSSKKDSHFVVEGNYWHGSNVTHHPCLDSYDREYFCGSLTAWSDFNYDHHPDSYNVKIWYEKLF